MPFDPSGNFTRVMNWQQDRDNGIRILADRHDAEDDNFAAAFNQVFLRGGIVPMTGDLNMGGYNINTIKAGSAAAPSLTWELDADTGFYQESPSSIGFSSNGVKHFVMHGNGTNTWGADDATVASWISTTKALRLVGTAASFIIQGLDATSAAFKPLTLDAEDIRFATSGTERMRINANGRVGINTTAGLAATFHVKEQAGSAGVVLEGLNGNNMRFYSDPTGFVSWSTNSDFTLGAPTVGIASRFAWAIQGVAEVMRLDGFGQLGIGTDAPGAALDVMIKPGVASFRLSSNLAGGNSVDMSPYITSLDNAGFQITVGATRRMLIHPSGNVGFSTPAGASYELQVERPSSAAPTIAVTATGAVSAVMQAVGPSNDVRFGSPQGVNMFLVTSGAPRIVLSGGGDYFYPNVDNATRLGYASGRWSELWVATGTFNPSDAREKTPLTALSEQELAAAKTIARGIGNYRWLESAKIDDKQHIGVTSQAVIAAMEEQGLDAFAYSFVRYDEWDAIEEIVEVEPIPAVTDKETGEVIHEPVSGIPGTPGRAAGNRYSVMYSELAMFIAAAQEQRLAALEALL